MKRGILQIGQIQGRLRYECTEIPTHTTTSKARIMPGAAGAVNHASSSAQGSSFFGQQRGSASAPDPIRPWRLAFPPAWAGASTVRVPDDRVPVPDGILPEVDLATWPVPVIA